MILIHEIHVFEIWQQLYLNPDLCDAVAVLYELSYQAIWELVIM